MVKGSAPAEPVVAVLAPSDVERAQARNRRGLVLFWLLVIAGGGIGAGRAGSRARRWPGWGSALLWGRCWVCWPGSGCGSGRYCGRCGSGALRRLLPASCWVLR